MLTKPGFSSVSRRSMTTLVDAIYSYARAKTSDARFREGVSIAEVSSCSKHASLRINPMQSRTIEQSHRPRVSEWTIVRLAVSESVTPFTRWDEKAGLLRDAIRSQWFDVLKAQRKGDRRCRRLAL